MEGSAQMKWNDGRQTAEKIEQRMCLKLRLADGSVRVVASLWWQQFLSNLLTPEKT
jgi:hypothetical protein